MLITVVTTRMIEIIWNRYLLTIGYVHHGKEKKRREMLKRNSGLYRNMPVR